MKNIEIIGHKRANLGKKATKKLRKEDHVPCVIYGGKEQIHFYTTKLSFKNLVYTPEAKFVNIKIEKDTYPCILQDMQFHPVSENILHADFLALAENKKITMHIPLVFFGKAPGVAKGGELIKRIRKLHVSAYPKDMPAHIAIDLSTLDFGKAIKVKDIQTKNYSILNPQITSIAVVEVPRALRGKSAEEETEAQEKDEKDK